MLSKFNVIDNTNGAVTRFEILRQNDDKENSYLEVYNHQSENEIEITTGSAGVRLRYKGYDEDTNGVSTTRIFIPQYSIVGMRLISFSDTESVWLVVGGRQTV